jgi:hypothetical protein
MEEGLETNKEHDENKKKKLDMYNLLITKNIFSYKTLKEVL